MQPAFESLGIEGTDATWREIFRALLPLYFHDYPIDEILAADRIKYREALRSTGFAVINEFDSRAWLGDIQMPTLIIAGRYDAILPPSHGQVLFKGIAQVDLVIFDRSGHFPFIEERPRFLEVVDAFLG